MNYAPGADDNASGTTAVLEIARVLKLLDFKPEVTFKFVTFAAEERGLHGSHDYAEKALQSGMKIRLMINHDMISHTLSPVESSTFDINYYTGSAGYLELARLAGQKFSVVAPRTGDGNPTNSDSYSFWVRGFRAVYFEETDFSYPYYHTPNDVISNYSMEYCAEVIKASCATLVASSMLPSEVRDIVVSDRGDGSSLLVRWAESRDFDHGEYMVGLGTASGTYDSLFTTSDTSVVLAGLDEGVTYYVGVTSIDVEGYESYLAESSEIPYTVPRFPDRFRAHPEWHEVVLSWSPPKETDLLGYNVFRSTAPGGPAVQLNSAILQDTVFVDNTAQNGVYYYYHAIAVDSGLNESQAAPVQKSRVVSLDQGLLLVDETKDGDGSPQNPTDAQTDAFYEALLEGFPVTHHDVSEEGSVGLADLGAHSTVFWYGDDISEMAVPLAAANEVKEYLDHGGRFFYAGYKPARAFSGNPALEAEFGPGDVVHDYLKIRATENGLFSFFQGAVAAGGGYSDVPVDSSKAGSASQFHLK
ncbi:MAG: M20/M25/M40 family metallo-hydrolase, partial [Bacteroidota bacterium]